MKIASINNYSPYSKTKFQPKNDEVRFGAIRDDRTRQLMSSMGMDPKDPLYEIYPFTLYTEGSKLKGKLTLSSSNERTIKKWHSQDTLDVYKARLESHDYTFPSKELVDVYFHAFKKLFYPEYSVVAPPDDSDLFIR